MTLRAVNLLLLNKATYSSVAVALLVLQVCYKYLVLSFASKKS